MRSRESRRHSPQLALLARPTHRCLRADPKSLAGRIIRMPRSPSPSTPFENHFWMPAEWERHEATWLGWPHELSDWPGKFPPIPWAFAEIVRHLSRVERVYLLVENRDAESRVRAILKKSGANLEAVDFFRVSTDRGWMRDSGPICVRNDSGEVGFNHFVFNGWAKYASHKK